MKSRPHRRATDAFSLLEVLIVCGIIALLISLLIPVVSGMAGKARQTKCKSNLRQFAVALNVYRSEHRGKNPPWLSNLYPKYIDTRELYICPADRYRGSEGGKPPAQDDYWDETSDSYEHSAFEETDDTSKNGSHHGRNSEIHRCSYLYEFNASPNSWWEAIWGAQPDSFPADWTWEDYKLKQLAEGDVNNGGEPYSESRMPIIRCFHHWNEGTIRARDRESGRIRRIPDPITINVGYAGNIFVAPLMWEERVDGAD